MPLLIKSELCMNKDRTKISLRLRKQTNNIFVLITLSFILMLSSAVQASEVYSIQVQQDTLTGKITDAGTDAPLVGVTIQIMQTAEITTVKGAKTQNDGTYQLSLPEGAKTIIVSISGYKTLMIDIEGRKVIDIAMDKLTSQEDNPLWGS
jgi:hypothetical protein